MNAASLQLSLGYYYINRVYAASEAAEASGLNAQFWYFPVCFINHFIEFEKREKRVQTFLRSCKVNSSSLPAAL